jgi:transcription elongation GreA/GreB family factor
MMNPDRIDRYDNYWKVKKILSRARPLEIPSQMIKVESGHKVTLSDDGEEKVFHICSELDSIYCKSDSGISGRLLSLDSRLGKEIEGCSVGNKVKAGKVVKIESSEYL